MTDYLKEDPKIVNQKWACVSFLTPDLVKGCKSYALKLRGVYNTESEAIKRINEIKELDNIHNIYIVEVGKWIAWGNSEDSNSELNEMIKYYKDKLLSARKTHEKRKNMLVNKKKEIEEIIEEVKDDIIQESNKLDETEYKGKEVKITIDEKIPYQNYYCVSFLTPESVDYKYNIRGFKLRGVFNTDDEAKNRCKTLYDYDNEHNIYVADVGHWVNWFDNPDKAQDFEYANENLNSIMKAQKENQEKVQTFYEENDIDDVNIGKTEHKEDVDENLDDIDEELMEAKRMYEKLLEEEN